MQHQLFERAQTHWPTDNGIQFIKYFFQFHFAMAIFSKISVRRTPWWVQQLFSLTATESNRSSKANERHNGIEWETKTNLHLDTTWLPIPKHATMLPSCSSSNMYRVHTEFHCGFRRDNDEDVNKRKRNEINMIVFVTLVLSYVECHGMHMHNDVQSYNRHVSEYLFLAGADSGQRLHSCHSPHFFLSFFDIFSERWMDEYLSIRISSNTNS